MISLFWLDCSVPFSFNFLKASISKFHFRFWSYIHADETLSIHVPMIALLFKYQIPCFSPWVLVQEQNGWIAFLWKISFIVLLKLINQQSLLSWLFSFQNSQVELVLNYHFILRLLCLLLPLSFPSYRESSFLVENFGLGLRFSSTSLSFFLKISFERNAYSEGC